VPPPATRRTSGSAHHRRLGQDTRHEYLTAVTISSIFYQY
jgi:hypothetical protein